MKMAHTITLSVFIRPGEDEESVRQALISLVPLELEKEKVNLRRTVAKANISGQSDIVIYEIVLEKERHTRQFIDFLKSRLSAGQKRELASQENRVDDECCFYMRLDKQKLLSGEYGLTDGGDCFHVRMSIAAYPKKREEALAVVRKIFQ